MFKISNKILGLLVLLLLPIGIYSTSIVTDKEISAFDYENGAQLRFNQLARSIDINSLKANIILDELVINGSILDEDYSYIIDQIQGLESLITLIREIDYENSNQELALLYISYKSDSIYLTNNIRNFYQNFINDIDIKEVNLIFNERKESVIPFHNQRIGFLNRDYNFEIVRSVILNTSVNFDNIEINTRNNENSMQYYKSQLLVELESLSKEDLNSISNLFKQRSKQDFVNNILNNLDTHLEERKSNQDKILKERLNKLRGIE